MLLSRRKYISTIQANSNSDSGASRRRAGLFFEDHQARGSLDSCHEVGTLQHACTVSVKGIIHPGSTLSSMLVWWDST